MTLADALVVAARPPGLVLDTNVLVLHVVGKLSRSRIATFKRTKMFTVAEFDALDALVRTAPRLRTTPHLLAEASNLLGGLEDREARAARRLLLMDLEVWDEQFDPALDARSHQPTTFVSLGVADWGVMRVCARTGAAAVTSDVTLWNTLIHAGYNAININHLRGLGL